MVQSKESHACVALATRDHRRGQDWKGRDEVSLTIIIASPDRTDVEHLAQGLLCRNERKCRDLPAAFESS